MSKIVVTGGAGFIGSHLAKKLADLKHQVIVFDNLSTGNLNNLQEIKNKIQFVKGDIRNLALLQKTLKTADFVVHLAALPGVFLSIKEPAKVNDVNIAGALNVLIAARDNKIKRMIFASSSSVYGGAFAVNKETQAPQPLSPYAVSKITGEYYLKNFYDLFGLPTVSLRFFNVFGPKQNPNSEYAAVIPLFIRLALQNKRPIIFGDGEQSRDFTYIDNVVDGIILAMRASKAPGESINLACGASVTVNQLIKSISRVTGKSIAPIYKSPRPGDIYRSQAYISKAKQILGIKKQISFEDGLAKTIAWYKAKS